MQASFLSFPVEKVIQPGILPIVFFLLTALSALCRFCYRKKKNSSNIQKFHMNNWNSKQNNQEITGDKETNCQ